MIEFEQQKQMMTLVFGEGSIHMTTFNSSDKVWLLLEPCPPGILGTGAETQRESPFPWNIKGATFDDIPPDGLPRVAMQFNSRAALLNLIAGLQDLAARQSQPKEQDAPFNSETSSDRRIMVDPS